MTVGLEPVSEIVFGKVEGEVSDKELSLILSGFFTAVGSLGFLLAVGLGLGSGIAGVVTVGRLLFGILGVSRVV